MSEAVLFACHIVNEEAIRRYEKLSGDLSGLCDVYWALQVDNKTTPFLPHIQDDRLFSFSYDDLNTLRYSPIAPTLVPGSLHFIMGLFFQQHPQYARYWFMEYDVMFTGNWSSFIGLLSQSDADMIASHIEFRCKANEFWPWWNSLSFPCDNCVDYSMQIKSFCPVFRLSSHALSFLDKCLQKPNLKGHCESLLCTVLHSNGFSVEDFGGNGIFTPCHLRNFFYKQDGNSDTECSLRWRPYVTSSEIILSNRKNTIYHPVKLCELQ